ncbi:MAG: PD40 domain-containing protein [Ignavibacteriae bacterium]|nr:PD40 domain-containing protein [Ignavibacteriota bacterium]
MKYFLYLLLTVIAFWCCEESTVKHVVIIGRPEWSPTGNTIAILKDEFDVRSDGCDCGEQPLSTPPAITNNLFLVDTNGVIHNQLTDDVLNIAMYEWSPSGKMIAFTSYGRGVGIIDTNFQVKLLGSSGITVHWSADGSEILFTNVSGNNAQLVARKISDGTRRILFEDSATMITSHSWSKGNRIAVAYSRSSYNYLAMMNHNGTDFRILDSNAVSGIASLTWSPDDSLIAYTYDVSSYASQQVFYFNIYTNEKIQRTNFPAGKSSISGLRFSPDGKYISVVSSLGLYIIERMGPSAQQIITGFSDCSWSQDSRRIVYVENNSIKIATIQ